MRHTLFILLIVLLAGCEGTIGFDDPDSLLPDPMASGGAASVGSGEELYQLHCAGCHGAQAEGAPSWPSSIQGYSPIASIVKSGRGAMPSIPVSDSDIGDIQAYILSLAPPAEQLDGEGIYQRYCASCHGADAAGAEAWPGSIQGYSPIESIVMNGRGDMAAIAITAEQTEQVQEWLLSLAPSLDGLSGEEVYDRLCITCHGKQGEGTATKGPQIRYEDDGYSAYWTRTGRPTTTYEGEMPSYPEEMISDQQLAEIFEFVDAAEHPTDGRGLFNRFCSNCHGEDGRGGPSGKDVRGEVSVDEEIIRKGDGGTNYASRRTYMSSWSSSQLTTDEMRLIAEYVNSL